jgi:dCTP deaminase
MILPSQTIRSISRGGWLSANTRIEAAQIQPASLDLRLAGPTWRVRASFLPGAGTVREKLAGLALGEVNILDGAILETDCVYVAQLQETLFGLESTAIANPKSSIGRLDVFVRVIGDGSTEFDRIAPGYEGPLYAVICPQTFPVIVRPGSRLAQLRFERQAPLAETARRNETVSIDLAGDGVIGYRAKRYTGEVDVDAVGQHAAADFWEPICARGDRLILEPGEFYILASKEIVRIPATHAAEMIPFNARMGEMRVHFAGFFDPGFVGRAVLEVRAHSPFVLEDGQIVGSLVYERMEAVPEQLYGAEIGSSYQDQGLKLSKHFRAP